MFLFRMSMYDIMQCSSHSENWSYRSILKVKVVPVYYGNTSCGVFKRGIQNKKSFWLKINIPKRKLFNFGNWCSRELSKSAKIWLSKSIFYVKIIGIFPIFFSLKNTNLGAHFLLLIFFDNINFYIILFSEMMPNFWQLATTPILRIQWFPLCMLIFSQKPV